MRIPVTVRHLLLSYIMVILVWLTINTLVYFWAKAYWKVSFPISNAPLTVQLPKYTPIRTSINNILSVKLDHELDVEVAVNQHVNARLRDTISLDAHIDTEVRLVTTIPFQTKIPVQAEFELTIPIQNSIVPLEVPVRLPLSFELPVQLAIPINTTIPIDLHTPVQGRVDERIPAQLQTTLISKIPLSAELQSKVLTIADARMTFPTTPTGLKVDKAKLELAINTIAILPKRIKDKNQPLRLASFYYDASRKPPPER